MPETTTTHEWIETVLEEHRQLNAMVADLRLFLEAPRPEVGQKGAHAWSTELTRHLVQLHDALFRHFREEEEGGMMEELTEAHPRATGAVEGLVHDHEKILKDCVAARPRRWSTPMVSSPPTPLCAGASSRSSTACTSTRWPRPI